MEGAGGCCGGRRGVVVVNGEVWVEVAGVGMSRRCEGIVARSQV